VSKNSSTSSWPDESLMQSSELDIQTGHALMDFLQQHLNKPDEISNQWKSLSDYSNKFAESSIAKNSINIEKNVDSSIIPYDDSLVNLNATEEERKTYINASKIYDSDPQQIAYIATQAPLKNTVAEFWQMIWEQGIVVIVNLTNQADLQQNERLEKYWPEESAKSYGIFEIFLVSEHIWSEDYLVRSLYLKNTATNETRTITQFHYLAWTASGCPTSTKSLLEFRRKVNKSYRGRSSPILVHCTNGAGRTGVYCLIDMAANRIVKGVKELDIAATLEHLRDQRLSMVENEQQYIFIFNSIADEVNALLKGVKP
jgi:receptor-type tyrosine-protein phosphatase N